MPLIIKENSQYSFHLPDGEEIGPFKTAAEVLEYKRRFKIHSEGYQPPPDEEYDY